MQELLTIIDNQCVITFNTECEHHEPVYAAKK
jgi:hypothetical protein